MIDLFALARLRPGERLEAVPRSHGLRIFLRLAAAAVFLAAPFFFLFDYRGAAWLVALVCWLVGLALVWLAFDIWSSSLVLVTTERVVGVERTSWGRVRVHDWLLPAEGRRPRWAPYRAFPWLGRLVWTRQDGAVLVLGWVRPPVELDRKAVLAPRRRQLARRLKTVDEALLARIEQLVDEQDRA